MKVDKPLNLSEVPVEVDSAARTFSSGLPIYKKLVDDLSLKSAKRLSKALVEYPFHNEKQALLQSTEAQVFELAMELLEAKVVMIQYTVDKKKSEVPVIPETKETENGKES